MPKGSQVGALLDAAAFAATCTQHAAKLGRFRWVARPAGRPSSSPYYLLETESPTPDGAAGRRYGPKELALCEYTATQPAASVPSMLPSTLARVDVGGTGLLTQLLSGQTAQLTPTMVASCVPIDTLMVREVAPPPPASSLDEEELPPHPARIVTDATHAMRNNAAFFMVALPMSNQVGSSLGRLLNGHIPHMG